MQYYLGVDSGGTLSKAVLFDEDGIQISSSSETVSMMTPKAGFTEREMEELWQVTARVIKKTVTESGIDPKQIAGVSCTGHGKGLYLWGKDGKPCYNGIVSTDTRAWEYPVRWEQDGTADRVFDKTFQRILACQPVSLLNWIKEHDPEVIGKIQWIFEVKDYIRFRLTGEAAAEITDYSGSNLLNCATRDYDDDLLKEFGLSDLAGALPPLKQSTDLCGLITREASLATGLVEGTPVSGGMFDIDACAAAMNITDEDHIAVIAGTWSINEYIAKKPVLDRSVMMNSLYYLDGYYLIEESSPTSASNHAWFTGMFLEGEKAAARQQGMDVYTYCDRLAATVEPDEQNIVFLPYLYGSNYDPQAKASLIGMDSHHSKAHMIRAVLEGIAFCHKVHLEKLLRNRSGPASIRLAGGVTASRLWVKIFCDIFGIPVEIIDTKELGALGCAMTAAVATGKYSSMQEAADHMVRIAYRVEPDKGNAEIYMRKYQLYKDVSAALEKVWGKFNF
jgi:L-xylulokinase